MNKGKGLIVGSGLLVVGFLAAKKLWSLSQIGDLLSFGVSSFKIHKISKGSLLDINSYKAILKIKLKIVNGGSSSINNVKIGLIKVFYSGTQVAYSKPTSNNISIPANDITNILVTFECPLSSSADLMKDVAANLLNLSNLAIVLKRKMVMTIAATVSGFDVTQTIDFNS